MIYIATALYMEANPWIQKFSLKKEAQHTKYQLFSGDCIRLIITGTGELRAAIALTYLFECYPPSAHDLFINFGLCASKAEEIRQGTCILCHKIKQHSTNRDLYPDMLFSHPFPEASIETVPVPPHTRDQEMKITETLVDMEAYAFMFTATYYMQPNQLMFLKVVSDHLTIPVPELSLSDTSIWLFNALQQLLTVPIIANHLQGDICDVANKIPSYPEDLFLKLSDKLRLSETMRYQLRQFILYYQCKQKDATVVMNQMLTQIDHNGCKTKSEGKGYFEQIKRLLME